MVDINYPENDTNYEDRKKSYRPTACRILYTRAISWNV